MTTYERINTAEQLQGFCDELSAAESIAFDTEFISERTYRPQLCLVQLNVDGRLAVIDPLCVEDLTPLWRALADGEHTTLVHAGREELRFALHAVGRPPAGLIDVQIAAALVGLDYPAGYSTLINRLLDAQLTKGETRTDWSRRPLTERQIEYALDDVRYLPELWSELQSRLQRFGRRSWLSEEMDAWKNDLIEVEQSERWRRVSGISSLDSKGLAVVRELWRWREREAERRDSPVKRVLRDDLIVEMARRKATDPNQIRQVRGMDRGDLRRRAPDMAAAVKRALGLPKSERPRPVRRETSPQIQLLSQFLTTVLSGVCRDAEIAVGIVGSVQDVRDLVLRHLDQRNAGASGAARLATGWRAEIVGRVIEDLLAGKTAVRVGDPHSSQPLVIVDRPAG